MITINRNGLSGLTLRIVLIGFAALMFGCAPRPAVDAPRMEAVQAG